MMDRVEYMAMADEAVAKYQILRAIISDDTEIVYVISREVYEAILSYEDNFWYEHIRVNHNADEVVGVFYGTRLAYINEDVSENLFLPVVYSRNFQHYDGLQVNDFIVFNDEDSDLLFRLARVMPDAMYADTGLTVSFTRNIIPETSIDNVAANLADNALTIGDAIAGVERAVGLEMERMVADIAATHEPATRADVYIHDTTATPYNPYTVDWGEAARAVPITADAVDAQTIRQNQLTDGTITIDLNGVQINADLLRELAGEISVSPRSRKKASKEKDLNPGDTKLLDEYLHSFLRGGC